MTPSTVAAKEWPPTKYLEYESTVKTKGCGPAVVMTDAGRAFIKPMADDVHPHSLAIELVCTRLAAWFGLPVLDTCILNLGPSDTFPRPRRNSQGAQPDSKMSDPGPAICTRAMDAFQWGGDVDTIKAISNTDDISKLVLFDTWIRNEDRYPPMDSRGCLRSKWKPNRGNVLLVREPPGSRSFHLVAMDFGHALVKGSDIPQRGFGIEAHKDDSIYGLFKEFRPFVTRTLVDAGAARLRAVDISMLNAILDEVPSQWDVSETARGSIAEHLCRRAAEVADTIKARLEPLCYAQGTLPGWQ